jgi:hypothetical protein
MEQSKSENHPLNFEKLTKGSEISREQIEKAYLVQLEKDPNGYRMSMLRLWQLIEDERPDLLVRIDGDSLRIMNDLEADDVTARRGVRAVRSLAKNAKRRAVIDRSDFSHEQKRIAESRDRCMTAIALLSRKELNKARRDQLLSNGSEDAEEEDF